jgi:hypothetical protein
MLPDQGSRDALTLARSDGPATAALADDDWSQKPAAAEGTTRALRHERGPRHDRASVAALNAADAYGR